MTNQVKAAWRKDLFWFLVVCGGVSQSTRVGKAWQLEGTLVLGVVAHRELYAWQ